MFSDVNECATNMTQLQQLHECSQYADCINTEGSYTCQCVDGYAGDGYVCYPTEIDECHLGIAKCHQHAECIDTKVVTAFTTAE